MSYNVSKQIQEAMERGDFKDLCPARGSLSNAMIIPTSRQQFAWSIRCSRITASRRAGLKSTRKFEPKVKMSEKLIAEYQRTTEAFGSANCRAQPLKRDAIRSAFELERTRALEAYTLQLQQLNQKIQQWNLMIPLSDKQHPLHNLDAATAYFHKQCPGL